MLTSNQSATRWHRVSLLGASGHVLEDFGAFYAHAKLPQLKKALDRYLIIPVVPGMQIRVTCSHITLQPITSVFLVSLWKNSSRSQDDSLQLMLPQNTSPSMPCQSRERSQSTHRSVAAGVCAYDLRLCSTW